MQNIRVFDGTDIAAEYRRAGRHDIVFIHPWAENLTVWDPEVRYFQREGYSTMRYDIRGHGLSSFPKGKDAFKIGKLTKELEDVIKHFKIRDPILIAHSMGSLIATEYALRHMKSVKAIVFVAPVFTNPFGSTLIKNGLHWLERIVAGSVRMMRKKPTEEFNFSKGKKRGLIYEMQKFVQTPHVTLIETAKTILDSDYTNNIKRLVCPILVISGGRDMLSPEWYNKKLFSDMDNVSFTGIKRWGHEPVVHHPLKLSHMIHDFIAGL